MKPSYYDKFNCIADKCDFTCCQEWKIGVDDNTLESWKSISAKSLLKDKNCFKGENLSDYVITNDGNLVMGLCENRLCPFLNESKLCNIVLNHGEEFISETCHTFPREIHEFDQHKEETLMLCCPHVIDLLNDEKKFTLTDFPEEYEDDELFLLRNSLIDFIQKDDILVDDSLLIIFYILLDCYELNTEADYYSDEQWELVPELKKTITDMDRSQYDTLNECNELMLDLIDNYLKEGVYKDHLELMEKEALDLETILEGKEDIPENELQILDDFNKEWEQYKMLIKKAIAQEFYGELISEDLDLEFMLVKFQWIVMEYCLIKHFAFLSYRKNKFLSYAEVKIYMVIAFRIMGFDDDDIYEYMENSFEELVWDWNYMALLLS